MGPGDNKAGNGIFVATAKLRGNATIVQNSCVKVVNGKILDPSPRPDEMKIKITFVKCASGCTSVIFGTRCVLSVSRINEISDPTKS